MEVLHVSEISGFTCVEARQMAHPIFRNNAPNIIVDLDVRYRCRINLNLPEVRFAQILQFCKEQLKDYAMGHDNKGRMITGAAQFAESRLCSVADFG